MSKRPIYLPIELQDVFELIEEGKSNMIYFSTVKGSLVQANEYSLRLSELPNIAFYVKQEYTPVEDQEVGKNETN
ncbi:TPA: hypothetical protein ACOIVK_001910 [Enterococcus faecalis]|uniref:hypothetical protein n=1 Tax=Enterococcus TaxID=1350 RepID=UPI002016C5EB|nr:MULTISPECIES: hypothetical protein [Enterococcus]MDT6925847.1 hypothetical protein [Enterococcus faecalis]MDT6926744.1 hypothetical protein [Enterococcus faecalis]MDT6932240.1 hypothetical protein [Enterococcus faecalis]MDT6935439.1 hypothetical protein [Enterococcus faecalis]BDP65010.1 hypothetical protein EfmJHP80_25060 [Enterococcus faecium]